MKHKSTNVRNSTARWLAPLVDFGWRFAPVWTANRIRQLYFRPKRLRLDPGQLALAKRAHAFSVDLPTQGKRLKVWSWGEGPSIWLVHGWSGRGLQMSDFVEPLVQAGFRVITYDKPAHGSSGKGLTNLFEFLEAFEALKKILGEPAGVLSHSMGAVTALWAARSRSLPLVLISPIVQVRSRLSDWAQGFGINAELMESLLLRLEREKGQGIDQVSTERSLPQAEGPILIHHATNDRQIPASWVQGLSEGHEGVTLKMWEGLGHTRILHDPRVIGESVEFLRGEILL